MTISAIRRPIIAFTLILIVSILTGTTSASLILSENPSQYIDTGGQSIVSGTGQYSEDLYANRIILTDIERARILNYIAFDVKGSYGSVHPEGSAGFTYSLPNGHTGEGVCYVDHSRNVLGQITATRYTLFFYDWDIGELTGEQTITINRTFATLRRYYANINVINDGDSFAFLSDSDSIRAPIGAATYISTVSAGAFWQNKLTVESVYDGLDYQINLQRVFDNVNYGSTLTINGPIGTLHSSKGVNDISLLYPADSVTNISIENPVGKIFTYPIGSSDPTSPAVTIYVRNSQTGNLLAGSHIIISASVGGEYHEVVNQTLPGGTATYTLQPTGGGLPNPDYYRLIATADGYNPYMPYIDFELDRPTNLIVMMEPITGGPVDENKTFIEFYVRDLSGNGISDASVTCGGYALITNSAGYTQFEMPKNAIYPYTVRKSGYVTIEGTATVGDGPRYVVNVVLGPKEIPTYTPDPGETPGGPGATPTPDRRTNEEKGQAVIDMIADNAEGIGALALICLLMGLLKLMAKW
jgi:hypothetical protein